jgi:hypothetical protein
VIVGNRLFVAVGDSLAVLEIPSLDLAWCREVDTATCFGVYYIAGHDCLITHGECEIARVSPSGDIAWSGSESLPTTSRRRTSAMRFTKLMSQQEYRRLWPVESSSKPL